VTTLNAPQGYAVKLSILAAAVCAAAVSLAGCASGTTTSTSTAPAVASTAAAPSTPAADAAGVMDGMTLSKKMADAFVAAKTGTLTMTMTSTGATTSAVPVNGTITSKFAVQADGKMDSMVTMALGPLNLDAVVAGGLMYMKMSGLKSKDGKPWIKIDPTGTDALSKQLAGQLGQAGDPRAQMEGYKDATVTLVSSSGGVTNYKLNGVKSNGQTVNGDVFISVEDSTGRPQKITMNISGVQAVGVFSAWGEPVSVTIPPADQVGPPPAM